MSFRINDRCTGCRACATICPTGAIRGERERPHVIDPARCIECGACGVTCRDEAVLDHRGALFSLFEAPARARAWVDLAACTGCGWCRSACGWDAVEPFVLTGDGDGPRRVAAVVDRRCVACGACELECPAGAVRVLRPYDALVDELRARNASFLRRYEAAAPPEDAVESRR